MTQEDLLRDIILLKYNDINLIQARTRAFEQDIYTGDTRYRIESGVENL